tara:strand:+ start:2164 stop:2592 length:429 start_codon:yes stop_codon:yes gene_type:complete
MFKKIFKKKEKKSDGNDNVMIGALLIHAAKIDDNYTEIEKNIIKKSLINLSSLSENDADKIMVEAEKKEKESNQLVEFTSNIKKKSMEFRLKIIEILWKIVYSDSTNDSYESNLIRRVCGLLYVSDKDSGLIKMKVKNLNKV